MKTVGTSEVRGVGRGRPGFTLLEMILVISTILFLLAFLVAMAGSAHGDSKKRATESLIHTVETAAMTYYNQWGDYPRFPAAVLGHAQENALSARLLYMMLTEAKYGKSLTQVPQGATDDLPEMKVGTLVLPEGPYLVDTWAAPVNTTSVAGNENRIGQIFYVAFSKAGLQANSTDVEQRKMWGMCGGVPLIWSLGPDQMGYDGKQIRTLSTAAALESLLYDISGHNADNIHNFRDIPRELTE